MFIVSIILFIVAFIVQAYFLYTAFKKKDNKYWIMLFSLILSSILGCFIIGLYEIVDIDRTDMEGLVIFILCILAGLVYAGVFILSIILKFIEKSLVNKSGKVRETLSKDTKKVAIVMPLLCTVFVAFTFCSFDYGRYEARDYIEEKRYDSVKEKKIIEMVKYLNDKYDSEYTVSDLVYYREENYDDDGGWFYSEYFNIPYIGIFDNGEKKITVADRKGILSDNGQLGEVNVLISDYFSEITGVKIDFVNIRDDYSSFEDNHIGMTMQNGFNELITKDNVDLFFKELLKGDCVELIFYVKDGKDREEKLNLLTSKLNYLAKENIDSLVIYFYDENEELVIKEKMLDLTGDHKYGYDGENTSDYDDECKFGYYSISNNHEFYTNYIDNEGIYTVVAYSKEKNDKGYKYRDKLTIEINNWIVYEFEKEVS